MEESLTYICKRLRKEILAISEHVYAQKSHGDFNQEQARTDQHSEMKANLMLAYRHLEDARMRLGKVCQAADTGFSCYKE